MRACAQKRTFTIYTVPSKLQALPALLNEEAEQERQRTIAETKLFLSSIRKPLLQVKL